MKPLEKYMAWRVLVHFLRNPTGQFYIKELSRLLGISPRSALEAVCGFEKEGLLKRKVVGQAHLFRLDNDLPRVKAMKRMDMLVRIHEARLVEDLLEADGAAVSLILYGSYSSGEYDEKSDLDLLMISPSGRSGVSKIILDKQKRLGMKVNLEVFELATWKRLERAGDVFISQVRHNHVVLYGSEIS
jgi:predicted nucleotidyltransferase